MAFKIDNLTDWPNQTTHIILDDKTIATFNFRYLAATEKWVFDVDHDLLLVRNITLQCHVNMLRQWINKIPFGLMCTTLNGLAPLMVDDFSSERVSLYVLSASDCTMMEKILRATVPEE